MAGLQAALLLSIFAVQFRGASSLECTNSPMDITFLLDSSDDTNDALFDQEKKITSNLVNQLWDGRNRFGLFTFGSNVYSQFHLDTYTSVLEIQEAMKYIWKATGKADVSSALDYSIKYAFLASNGGRIIAPDIIFLVTSSDVRNETLINMIVSELHASEIELNIVIVGNHISQFWYEKLTSLPRILKIKDANALASIAESIRRSLCKGRGILRPWTSWSACGSSCGFGLKRRYRTCEKRHQDDDDCDGELLDEEECLQSPCQDPVDGMWSSWGKWTGCSKTCGTGSRSRIRTCSAPFLRGGGKSCAGNNSQKQDCSDWSCPDCNRVCPAGSQLAKECDVCICSNVILHGYVQTDSGNPINDAGIFLNSKLYEPISTTDVIGVFSVADICVVNEMITVKHTGYSPKSLAPKVVNTTHWFINVTLTELVAPIFVIHPEDKFRLVGQSVSLCCKAAGSPDPTTYTWLKGTDVIHVHGVNGTLAFPSLRTTDAGKYQCIAETDAGSTRSNLAVLTVRDAPTDTCTDPKTYIEELPVGCYVKDDASRNSTIDVRSCGKKACVSRDLQDNGTCSEWWPFHCCDTAEKDLVDIVCDGFSYQTTRIKSCKCQICFTKTTITGKAFGRSDNGTTTPLKLGNIYANGQKVSRTNMNGVFSFEIPRRITKLVLKFEDDVFKKFIDSTKVVYVSPGSNTAVKLALALRPDPQTFNSTSDLNIEVGGSNEFEPAGGISIQKNSLVTADGKPYTGQAKARIHYMDPRKRNDFEAADGQFVYHEDGDVLPLETFGVFGASFEDNKGELLYSNKPMSFEVDCTAFNISSNDDGEPNVELWHMDENSGSWVTAGKMKYKTVSGRRRAIRQIIVGTGSTTNNIPQINLFEPTYQTTTQTYYVTGSRRQQVRYWNGWRWNVDMKTVYYREPRQRAITVKGPDRAKRNACFISVMVYKTFAAKETVGKGIQVTAVTKEGNSYKGYDRRPTDENGHICLSIFCDATVYLSAENNIDLTPLRTFPKHDLPRGYTFENTRNGTQVQLTSRNTLDVITDSGERRFSPVYYVEDDEGNNQQRCLNNYANDFKFLFAQSIAKAAKLDLTQPENVYDNKISWYPTPPDYVTRTVCFLKALIKIRDNYDVRFLATSYQDSRTGGQYGTYNAGPMPEPTYSDMINRAVCVEFRCPGLVNDKGSISSNVKTFVEVRVNPPKPACQFRQLAKDLSVTEIIGGRGFQVVLQPGKSYGPKYGVYIATDNRAVVERFCSQGKDTGTIDIGMNPSLNAAVEYDCTAIVSVSNGKIFSLNDTTKTPDLSQLTTALDVNGEYRYPCYVSIGVYKTPDLNEAISGATVNVLTRHRSNADLYYGYSSAVTTQNGHACVLTLCRKKAILFVETGTSATGNFEKLYAVKPSRQQLPPGYTYDILLRNEEINFNVRNWGTVFGKTGPVYNLNEKTMCLNAGLQNYHFTYSFLSIKENLTGNLPLTTYFEPLSWYYADPLLDEHQVCFMKIKVKISSYQAKLTVRSSSNSTGEWYGTFVAGPKASPESNDTQIKAACMEFRCAVRDFNDVKMNTTVTGFISTASSSTSTCTIIGSTNLKRDIIRNSTAFQSTIRADDNYGADEGIYKNHDRELAKSFCYTGSNAFLSNYKMNPSTNFFISYDCSL